MWWFLYNNPLSWILQKTTELSRQTCEGEFCVVCKSLHTQGNGELSGGQRVSESGLPLNCRIISRLISRGQMNQADWRSHAIIVTLCLYVLKDRLMATIKKDKDTSGKVDPFGVQKHKCKHGFTGDFNKPHQKHSVTLQNSMFVSPESYKSQHEIHCDFTLSSYKIQTQKINFL